MLLCKICCPKFNYNCDNASWGSASIKQTFHPSYPFSSGMTLPTALAAPVEAGMMFCPAVRPSLHAFALGPSTVFCVAVYAWMVVIRPSMMPNLSLMTLANGARQLVVHDALLERGQGFWNNQYNQQTVHAWNRRWRKEHVGVYGDIRTKKNKD